jgi:sortase (surface protein transpeptidase)
MAGGRGRRARIVATLAGVTLAGTAAIAVAVGVAAQHPPPPQPSLEPAQSATTPGPAGRARDDQRSQRHPAASPPALGYSEPERVSIPSIGVESDLVHLGLDSRGVMQTPQDPDKAGWFTPSPAPGVPGASVLAGHVTWDQQPVVFYRLGELRQGDKIEVARKDGRTAVFEVTRLGEFPKTSFPTRAVYGQVDRPSLRLITCGGTYDEETNSYQANVIVWAALVDTTT